MSAEAEAFRFDQHRKRFGADFFDRFGKSSDCLFGIGDIEQDSLHSVTFGACDEVLSGKLFGSRCRVGKLVVFDDEENWNPEKGGDIHAFVDIAGAAGAISEKGKSDGRAILTTLGI